MIDIQRFIQSVLRQDRKALPDFFHDGACVNWHCTNERFSVEEYVRANCEYPGTWDGKIKSIDQMGEAAVVVTRVFSLDGSVSCHCVSRIHCEGARIRSLDEYWADDEPPPRWRREMKIGAPIRKEAMK